MKKEDIEFLERKREISKKFYDNKKKDPEFMEKKRLSKRRSYNKRKKDPEFMERRRQISKKWREGFKVLDYEKEDGLGIIRGKKKYQEHLDNIAKEKILSYNEIQKELLKVKC